MIDLLILAVVQGIAEFLPISSSGHLVILGQLIGLKEDSATVNILLHAGTLGSILVIYWRRILRLLTHDHRVIGLLVIGTLPAVVVGLTIKMQFEEILSNPLLAGTMLLVTGGMLVALSRLDPGQHAYTEINWFTAFIVGCFQAFAILPGISRSGSTIVGGQLMGIRPEDSVTFSFLLAIPAIIGAVVLESLELIEKGVQVKQLWPLLGASFVAFGVGIFALRWLVVWSRRGRLHHFAWWCFLVGISTIVLCLVGAERGASGDA